MADTVVDTNVFLDLSGEDPVWYEWSSKRVAEAADQGALVINQVIYSELAGGYERREDLDAVLVRAGFRRENVPWDAAFLAGLAFRLYRRRRGARQTPLPDFYIGAHAAVRNYRLLTRDRGYYASYFPTVSVISPESRP